LTGDTGFWYYFQGQIVEVGVDKLIPALRLTGIGFFIGICIAGGALAGWKIGDEKPLFMIIGLLAGLVIAVFGVYRMIRPLMNNRQDKENS
jgi:F0F1-type ATP synthase assembly protein I